MSNDFFSKSKKSNILEPKFKQPENISSRNMQVRISSDKENLKFYLVYLFFYFRLSSRRIRPLTSPLHLSLSFATLIASVHMTETRAPNFPF